MNFSSMTMSLFKRIRLVVVVFVLAGVTQAHAGNWIAQHLAAAPDGTLRLLWGTTTSDGSPVVALWKLDTNGHKIGSGPVYESDQGSSDSWSFQQFLLAPDGTSRLFWKITTHAAEYKAAVWTFDASGNRTSSGAVYGPYSTSDGGQWEPIKLALAPDGTARLLWNTYSGKGPLGTVWKLDAAGNEISGGPIYGPYKDSRVNWVPRQIQVASDGTSRLLWETSGSAGNQAAVWTLDASGNKISMGAVYGPYTNSNGIVWTVRELVLAPDDTLRLRWGTDSSGNQGETVAVWTLDTQGNRTSSGPVYGPYKDNSANWFPLQFLAAPDGTSRLLWSALTVLATVWTLDAGGTSTSSGTVYGPYSTSAGGYWGLREVTIASDGTSRLLWSGFDSQGVVAGVWKLDAHGHKIGSGPVFGPYTY